MDSVPVVTVMGTLPAVCIGTVQVISLGDTRVSAVHAAVSMVTVLDAVQFVF